MSDKPKQVSVTALKFHTNDGEEYQAGDTYDVDADQVESLAAQGMAKPSDQVKADEKAAKADAKAAASHPVTPLGTDDLPHTAKPKK